MKENKKDYTIVSIRFDTDLLEEFKRRAEIDNRTFSNYVVNILKKNLK